MYYSKVSNNKYLIRLVKTEELGESTIKFCKKLGIKNAYLTAIGAVESPTLSYFDVRTKKFLEKTLDGDYELTSFIGNVAVFKNEPLLHAHLTISDKEMKAFGGHFVKARVAASVEIVLDVLDTKYSKSNNREIGLKLWDLPESLLP